ncbi:MAG TPA: DUF1697 domain-containing protein [Acidimicrobiia bacterium]|nr:DUF1697 domain-containing protein [Acidimicrobiia bacterium]
MTTYVALLRGINLAGKRKVAMSELRSLLEAAGFEDVSTYIQSGNIVLRSGKPAVRLRTELEKLIEVRFGFAVPVILRSRKQLDSVIAANPFPEPSDPRLLHVVFLEKAASAAAVKKLAASATGSDEVKSVGKELYLNTPDGFGRSKLAAALAKDPSGITGTARNWRTVLKLAEMAAGSGS